MKNLSVKLVLTFVPFILFVGCGSTKNISVNGYKEDDFLNKNIALVTGNYSDFNFENPKGLSVLRGIEPVVLPEQVLMEFRNEYPKNLMENLNQNVKIFHYFNQSFGAMYPLEVQKDFGENVSWDKLDLIYKNAKVDFFLVLKNIALSNKISTKPDTDKVGDETVKFDYMLLDPKTKQILTSGKFTNTVLFPRTLTTTLQNNASELVKKLPFPIKETSK